MLIFLSEAKKAIVSALGVALTGLTFAHGLTFLPGSWIAPVGVLLAILTPIATWLTPGPKNKPAA